jgi:GAF domain-containing protein
VTENDNLSAELLQSVVDVARAFFGAQASSLFLLDTERDELVFQSVSGRGEGFLVGRRFPATSGIAGWVVATGEPMIVDDLTSSPTFDRDLAESTEYVPTSLMAAPMVHRDRILGVLEVLDPVPQSRSSLGELDLLALFARQAATALRIVVDRDRGLARPETALDLDVRAAAQQLIVNLQRLMGVAPA